ncbi:hypothetical protein ATE62_22125 [Sphingopyxis sp. HIX]|nr:hypothetical protein ATE62_22125 [Sphingopyxis sp. HIX]KTE75043.1 hypothetical protein ATE72_21280 [Sphingopyxis sp. HXXIV]
MADAVIVRIAVELLQQKDRSVHSRHPRYRRKPAPVIVPCPYFATLCSSVSVFIFLLNKLVAGRAIDDLIDNALVIADPCFNQRPFGETSFVDDFELKIIRTSFSVDDATQSIDPLQSSNISFIFLSNDYRKGHSADGLRLAVVERGKAVRKRRGKNPE